MIKKEIIIIGNGLTSKILSLLLFKLIPNLKITVIGSPNIKTIDVGESFIPIFLLFLKYLSIDVDEFLKYCTATYKIGNKYIGWTENNFYHFFPSEIDNQYLENFGPNDDDLFLTSELFARENMVLKYDSDISFLNFSFHVNNKSILEYFTVLQKMCSDRLDIKDDHIEDIQFDENGYITQLISKENRYKADFYFDSTGLSKLIPEKLSMKKIKENSLINNVAYITTVNNVSDNVNNYTEIIKMKNGWMWNIPFYKQNTYGYVTNDSFTDIELANKHISKYLNTNVENIITKNFDNFYYLEQMKNNYCLVGLSSGFIEPMEATNIGVTLTQAFSIVNMIKDGVINNKNQQKMYNKHMFVTYESINTFLSLSYLFNTTKVKSDYWEYFNEIDYDINIIENQIFNHKNYEQLFFNYKINNHRYPKKKDIFSIRNRHNKIIKIFTNVEKIKHLEKLKQYMV